MLRGGYHVNKHLQSGWLKHGGEAFAFEILEVVEDPSRLIEREQHYIDYFAACDPANGYNRRAIAHSNLGMKFCPEAVERIRQSQLGKSLSEAHKQAIGDSQRGKAKSPDAGPKISAAKRGIKRPGEWSGRMAISLRKFSEEEIGRMHEMRNAGLSYERIAKEFGCVVSTAHRVITKRGLAYRQQNGI